MAQEVFISYSQPDRECALQLVESLESSGIGCWIAPRDIAPAADWAAEIIDAISAAKVMVLIFSASSNQSPQVRREVERAVHKHVSILPVRIADVLPSKSLEYFLSSQHWLDAFPPPLEPHLRRLATHLTGFLSGRTRELHTLPTSPGRMQHAALQPGAADSSGLQAALPVRLEAEQLRRIEVQLAGYIGPVARQLVKRAAARASSLDEIVGLLAVELESDSDRRKFAAACGAPRG